MKRTIRAIHSWLYFYLIWSYVFIFAFFAFLVVISNADAAILFIMGMVIFMGVIIFSKNGALMTSRITLSKEGFVQKSWFGLQRYEVKWEECFGNGFFMRNMHAYMPPLLYFLKEWAINGVNFDGSINWKHFCDEPRNKYYPRIGRDICQLEYTPKIYQILREYLPEHIRKELDEQTNAFQEALPVSSPNVKARNFFGIGKKK